MFRKSLQSGLLIGFLLALALSFAVISDQSNRVMPESRVVDLPLISHDLLRSFSLVISALLLLFIGSLAAMRVRPYRIKDGLNAGAISGLIGAAVVYAFLLSPLIVLRMAVPLYHSAIQDPTSVNEAVLAELAAQTWQQSLGIALLVPILGLVLGALEGLIYALFYRIGGARPAAAAAGPVLLDQVRQARKPLWEGHGERPLRAGLIGGLIIGVLLSLELTLWLVQVSLSEGRNLLNVTLVLSSHGVQLLLLLTVLLVPFALALRGGMGVLLLKNPPTRFASRFAADAISAATSGALVTLVVILPVANAALILGPFAKVITGGQVEILLPPDELLTAVRGLFLLYPFGPSILVLTLTLTGFLVGVPIVLISAFLWPRRPVDRAARLFGRLRRQPDTLLPQIYELFQRDFQAEEVLLHLAQYCYRRNQSAAVVAAAYHTICRSPERTAEALRAIVDSLANAPTWRWQREISELHRFLNEGWQARTSYHLSTIQPLAAEHTTSLPAVLTQAWEHLSNVIAEVKKAHRVDDPNGRSIFLNRALEEIAAVEAFAAEKPASRKGEVCATPYPEQRVLLTVLPRWRTILHEALRDLRGRAVLRVELQTHQVTFMPRLTLRLRVANEGLNMAEQVRVGFEAAPDYQMVTESEARIELLPPGEERIVELALQPRNPRSMRVLVHILYNDAVDENRELTLADEVVFAAAERPFQRIFPIPYVTGTPLKTPEMFFGRQDVFAYVREHLLGAYQNNIIVLHGQRRTGKTSVLYQLPRVMGETHYCVLLDMQGLTARSEADFFYTLSDEIAYTLQREGLSVGVPPREEYDAQPEFTFRNRFLRGVYPTLGEKHLLLLFDEFEELQHHVEQGHMGTEVFSFLRNLMQHEQPVDFVFSGTHKLEELAAEYWSILFNIATYKQITFLERSEVERLVTEPVAPYGMEYDPLAVEHIYRIAAGHPFLTQLVCHEMVAYHNETERSYITVADVDVVLERIAERGEAHFKHVWAEADPYQRAVLLALAEILSHTDGATRDEIAALSERRSRQLDGEMALRALVRLESRDIVARTAPGSERFRFRVDLVRRWIVCNPQLADEVNLGPS